MAASLFLQELKKYHQAAMKVDRWQLLFYDQLNLQFLQTQNTSTGLIFIETTWKPQQRPYHKQKLAFILANMRHFALE